MIAPQRKTGEAPSRRALRSARLAVAAALLGDRSKESATPQLVPVGQAWAFLGWMIVVALASWLGFNHW
jgi:hypothetical protein